MRHVTVLLLGACLAGCQSRSSEPPAVMPLPCPAPTGSAEPNLSSAGQRLYLSWLTHLDAGLRLEYAVLQGGLWSDVRTIAAGDSFFANWADFPSLAELADGSLVAHWLRRSGSGTYAYDVRTSRSQDGRGWSPGTSPHRDGTQTEHGFVSIVPDAQGGATLVWLDGRDYAVKEHDEGEMQLRGTRLAAAAFAGEQVLDARV